MDLRPFFFVENSYYSTRIPNRKAKTPWEVFSLQHFQRGTCLPERLSPHSLHIAFLVLKANVFPALGFSLLLKHEKYLLVTSQGQDPSGFAKYAPHVAHGHVSVTQGKLYTHQCKASPKALFSQQKMGEICFGGRKRPTQPGKQPPPHPAGMKHHHRASGSIRSCQRCVKRHPINPIFTQMEEQNQAVIWGVHSKRGECHLQPPPGVSCSAQGCGDQVGHLHSSEQLTEDIQNH